MILNLAWRSLINRRFSVMLTLLSIMISVTIVLGVEHVRNQARASFSRTVSGVDLVVGAPTGATNLLLSSVFRIGNASNGIGWDSYRHFAEDPRVAWTIPLAMGDTHRGYRVLGTTDDYLAHYRYGVDQAIAVDRGRWFEGATGAVLGAAVADALGYNVGDSLVLSHGLGEISFSQHDDHPFTVTGVLAGTGTPIDQTIHIALEGMDAIHQQPALPSFGGVPPGRTAVVETPAQDVDHEHDEADDHDETADDDHDHEGEADHLHQGPDQISAFMVGLENRRMSFALQREINEFNQEPLLAILPGLALAELWEMMGVAENVLHLIAIMVMLASLLGLATMLLSSMNERQREIALFRAIGMHAASVLFLVELEAILVTCLAIAGGLLVTTAALTLGRGWLSREYGLFIDVLPVSGQVAAYLGVILIAAALLALFPAMSAYRSALGTSLRQR